MRKFLDLLIIVDLLLNVLFKYNLDAVKCINLTSTTQWNFTYKYTKASSTQIKVNIICTENGTLCPFQWILPHRSNHCFDLCHHKGVWLTFELTWHLCQFFPKVVRFGAWIWLFSVLVWHCCVNLEVYQMIGSWYCCPSVVFQCGLCQDEREFS